VTYRRDIRPDRATRYGHETAAATSITDCMPVTGQTSLRYACRHSYNASMNAIAPSRERECSAEQAAALITSHMRVFLSGNCAVPQRVLAALVARAAGLTDVLIIQVLTVGNTDYVAP